MSKKNKKAIHSKILLVVIFILVIVAVSLIIIVIKNNNILDTSSINETKEVDVTAPEITINNNVRIIVGDSYIEDVKAIDDIDGDITDKVQITGEINTSTIGSYTLNYSIADSSGNEATAKKEIIVCNELKNGLPVLMYHFFYDENERTGPDNNWIEVKRFEEHIKYLSDENFYFPTWTEVEDYIDGKIKLPEKSVVITVDDGDDSFFDLAVPIIQKYNAQATSFLITAWYGDRAKCKEKNVYYESHSDDMHEPGSDGKGRIMTWSYDQICADLKTSSRKLGGSTIFCYPFGHYNANSIQALKDTGYKLAFTIQGGRVFKGSSKYELPRVRISSTTTLSQFKSLVN